MALVSVLVMPTAALAVTTEVTGTVIEGYTFTAPGGVALGNMTPGTPKAGSTTGTLVGNDSAGYPVTGADSTGSPVVYMTATGDLDNMLNIGPSASPSSPLTYGPANVAQTFLSTSGITNATVPFYVSQLVTFADPVQSGFTIIITFTVTPGT